jgi:hypothetical protein
MAFCLSGDQVGDLGRRDRLPRLCFYLFVSTMTQPNNALEPTAVLPVIMTITDNITSPASVTPLSAAVAQLGR